MSAPEDAEVVGGASPAVMLVRVTAQLGRTMQALLAEQAARQRAEAERDEARQIVRDIHWMARRYADGRQSYAVSQCNDALKKGFDAGWLDWKMDAQESRYARDGMFSPEWKGLEQRLAEMRAERDEALDRLKALAVADYKAGQDIARCCEAEVAELRAKLERVQEAFKKIEAPLDCGCKPCTGRCKSQYALMVELQERQDIATEALAALAKRKEAGK